jgi:hypothetical protein
VFFWKIGGKQPETLVVNRVKEGAITHDGVPDEPFWDWQPLNRAVAGSPTADARFALVYDVTSRGSINGIWVAVEVKNAGSTPAEGEGVDVYADALHNFEVIFNADDFHFFYPRDGQGDPLQLQGQRGRQHYKTWEVAQTEDGYTMEIKLGADGMFFGNGATLVPEALLVYGFNVGVRQGEGGEHRLLWRGTTEVDDDTSGFGSILLSQFPPSEGDLLGENLVEWRFLEGVTTAELDPTATRASAWLTGAPSLETGPGLRKVDREAASEDSFALFAPDNPERSEEDYVEFQVAPRQGAAISLTRLDLSLWTNREDEFFSAELRWSDDDFATSQAIPLSIANPIQFPTRREGYPITADLSGIEPLQGLQEPVTLRLYLWGANGSIIGLGRRNMMPDLLLLGTTHELTGDAAFEAEDAL